MWLETVEGGLVRVSWAELYARILFLFLVGNVPLRAVLLSLEQRGGYERGSN